MEDDVTLSTAIADCDVDVVLQLATTSGVVMQLKGTPASTCKFNRKFLASSKKHINNQ